MQLNSGQPSAFKAVVNISMISCVCRASSRDGHIISPSGPSPLDRGSLHSSWTHTKDTIDSVVQISQYCSQDIQVYLGITNPWGGQKLFALSIRHIRDTPDPNCRYREYTKPFPTRKTCNSVIYVNGKSGDERTCSDSTCCDSTLNFPAPRCTSINTVDTVTWSVSEQCI